jgi:hypothetical protein
VASQSIFAAQADAASIAARGRIAALVPGSRERAAFGALDRGEHDGIGDGLKPARLVL